MEIEVNDIKVGDRFRKDLGDIEELAASIMAIGLLHPVVIDREHRLIAGLRRLRACRDVLGWSRIPCRVIDLESIVLGERDENLVRKGFLPSELWAIGNACRAQEEQAARERKAHGGRPGKLPERITGDTRDRIAKGLGISGRTWEKLDQVMRESSSGSQDVAEIVEKMDRTGRIAGAFRKLGVHKAREGLSNFKVSGVGEFGVIVVDPPWMYDSRADDESHRAANPYPSMTISEIAGLVPPAAKDCILWLWTTNAHLPEAFGIVAGWGFTYKTMLTWVKDRFGTGDWLRGQTEHCLLTIKGNPVVDLRGQSTVIHGPLREHSRKPDEFYQMVESLCVDPRRTEWMFAREQREGWEVSGLEVTR